MRLLSAQTHRSGLPDLHRIDIFFSYKRSNIVRIFGGLIFGYDCKNYAGKSSPMYPAASVVDLSKIQFG